MTGGGGRIMLWGYYSSPETWTTVRSDRKADGAKYRKVMAVNVKHFETGLKFQLPAER